MMYDVWLCRPVRTSVSMVRKPLSKPWVVASILGLTMDRCFIQNITKKQLLWMMSQLDIGIWHVRLRSCSFCLSRIHDARWSNSWDNRFVSNDIGFGTSYIMYTCAPSAFIWTMPFFYLNRLTDAAEKDDAKCLDGTPGSQGRKAFSHSQTFGVFAPEGLPCWYPSFRNSRNVDNLAVNSSSFWSSVNS